MLALSLTTPRPPVWLPVSAVEPKFDTIVTALNATLGPLQGLLRVPMGMGQDMARTVTGGSPAAFVFVPTLVQAGGFLPAAHPWNLDAPDWMVLVLAQLHPNGAFAWGAGLLRYARGDHGQAARQYDELSTSAPGYWFLVPHPGRPRHGRPGGDLL